jgi:hypothetical protein
MKSFLQIVVFLFATLSLAHGQSLSPCTIPRAITQSCYIAPGTYTVASTITISQSDILIKCLPGATLVQEANTSIFRVTGNNVTIDAVYSTRIISPYLRSTELSSLMVPSALFSATVR